MRYVSLGHLALNDDSVRDIDWQFALNHQVSRPIDETLAEWNHFSAVGVTCALTVNIDEVRRSLEIANDLVLSWFLVVKCRPSPVALSSQPHPLVDGRQEISLLLPAGSVSGQLHLEISLIVTEPSKIYVDNFAPSKVGQTVFRSKTRLILEGEGGQLPFLPVSFSDQGIPHSESSLWWLRFLTRELDESANSALWLWINTDNPELEPLLQQSDNLNSLLWLKFLKIDFMRQLLSEALRNNDLDTKITYPEDSLGEMLSGLVRLVGSSIQDVTAEYEDDPGRVEAKLQAIVNGVN